jgi:hypothetical protein
MKDEFLMIRIDGEKKKALQDRAFDLHIKGGMSELVVNLIDKELAQPVTQVVEVQEARK